MNWAVANFLTDGERCGLGALLLFQGTAFSFLTAIFCCAMWTRSRSEDRRIFDLSDFMTKLRRSGAVRHALYIDAFR
jgi:hypothetical protein